MIHPPSRTIHWLWWTLQNKSHQETDYPKRYVGAIAHFCDIIDIAKLMWSKLALLFGKKAGTRLIRYVSSLFPYRGEKGACTISRKASSFQKWKWHCFVSSSSRRYPSNCLTFWRPQTIGRRRLSGIMRLAWTCTRCQSATSGKI